jgi:hypothetical protein
MHKDTVSGRLRPTAAPVLAYAFEMGYWLLPIGRARLRVNKPNEAVWAGH